MKKLLFLILLIIPIYSIAQNLKPIDGFWGIKFGTNLQAVKDAMQSKNAVYDAALSNPNFLLYTDAELDKKLAKMLIIKFDNNRFYEAGFMFKADSRSETINFYRELLNDLNSVYGPGKTVEKFKSPYTSGKDEIRAIITGYADFHTTWTDGSTKNRIILSIEPNEDLYISIDYQDGPVKDVVTAKENKSDRADF